MTVAPRPVWLITYEGAQVSDELSPLVLSAEYVDHLSDASGELRLTVDNSDGRWLRGWYPTEGDRIRCQMGLEGQPLLDTGEFRIVDCEASGAPDVVTISALSAPLTSDYRAVQSRAFESTTLGALVDGLAAELGLTVVGAVAQIPMIRVTQNRETNVAFLRRLARDYGYAFAIRPPDLVFYELAALEGVDDMVLVERAGMASGWALKGGPQELYSSCELRWLDPTTKELRVAVAHATQVRTPMPIGSAASGLALPQRTLRRNMRGDDVRDWQTFLASRGYGVGGLDGIFGAKTESATRGFQADAGIGADGVVGPETKRVAVEQGYLEEPAVSPSAPTGRVLRLEERVENAQQAEARARAALGEANRLRAKGTLPLRVGDARLTAGRKLWLSEEFGRFFGPYLIQSSKHVVSRSRGYSCSAEVTYV